MRWMIVAFALMVSSCSGAYDQWASLHYAKVMYVPEPDELAATARQKCNRVVDTSDKLLHEALIDRCVWAYMSGYVDRVKAE